MREVIYDPRAFTEADAEGIRAGTKSLIRPSNDYMSDYTSLAASLYVTRQITAYGHRTNCKNCGARYNEQKCDYCGTPN